MPEGKCFGGGATKRLDASIHSARALVARRGGVLVSYEALLLTVWTHTGLLSRRGSAEPRAVDVNTALLAIALHYRDWLRLPDEWRPKERSPWLQLTSLAEHLFAMYPMPRFMTSVWLEGALGTAIPQHDWYKVMGRGENIRRANVPMPITRAMAHRFASAPSHLTAIAALRWAQVLARGGSEELARAVIETRLGRQLDDEAFWETVIVFLVNHPEVGLDNVGPIVDFLQHHRPFDMTGRSAAALLRRVGEWHGELGRTRGPTLAWNPSPLHELLWMEEGATEVREWTISEICTSVGLRAEGRAMRHCVASYVDACRRGRTSIWSMQVVTPRGRRRVLTIEVDVSARRVRQARRKCNAMPREPEKDILARWAAREGLALKG